MPKATVDENDFLSANEHQVGASRQVAAVQAITKAELVDDPAHRQFRARILALYGPHDVRPLARRERIGHGSPA